MKYGYLLLRDTLNSKWLGFANDYSGTADGLLAALTFPIAIPVITSCLVIGYSKKIYSHTLGPNIFGCPLSENMSFFTEELNNIDQLSALLNVFEVLKFELDDNNQVVDLIKITFPTNERQLNTEENSKNNIALVNQYYQKACENYKKQHDQLKETNKKPSTLANSSLFAAKLSKCPITLLPINKTLRVGDIDYEESAYKFYQKRHRGLHFLSNHLPADNEKDLSSAANKSSP